MVIFTLYIGYIDKETDKQKHQQIDKILLISYKSKNAIYRVYIAFSRHIAH